MSISNSSIQARRFKYASELRLQGNKHFNKKDFQKAIGYYSECISILLSMEINNAINESNFSKQDISRDELTFPFNNRAEASIKLGHFEAALGDANRALKSLPKHLKSLCRKGRALRGLNCYKDSVDCLELALSFHPNNEELKKELEISKECYLQCSTGRYDLVSLCKEACDGQELPNCGEYVGPVTIAAAEEGKGRGLFVTKDVECGELLLVSNAIVVGEPDPPNYNSPRPTDPKEIYLLFNGYDTQKIAQEKLLDKMRCSERLRKQIYSLSYAPYNSVYECDNIPDLELFSPGLYNASLYGSQNYNVNVNSAAFESRIRSILKLNSFKVGKSHSDTLWLLPSFINHSCIPNASFMHLGTSMFVRAARKIKKGEEVTISYENVLCSYKKRQEILYNGRGFKCKCQRCVYEGRIGSQIGEMVLSSAVKNRVSLVEEFPNNCARWEGILKRLVDCNGATQQQLNWLRASFSEFYINEYMFLGSETVDKGSISPVDVYVTSIKDTVGTSEALLQIQPELNVAAGTFSRNCAKRLKKLFREMEYAMYGVRSPEQITEILASHCFPSMRRMNKFLYGVPSVQTPSSISYNEIGNEFVMALSNRAEAGIRLSHYEDAFWDASRALVIDPVHRKSLWRKGKALRCLNCYKESLESFELGMSITRDEEEKLKLKQEMEISEEYLKQQCTGSYDLASLCKQAAGGKHEIICGEFVGPVVPLASEKGKGVFLTENVKCGDLLIVNNALVVAEIHGDTSEVWDAPDMLLERMKHSHWLRKKIYSISQNVEKTRQYCDKITDACIDVEDVKSGGIDYMNGLQSILMSMNSFRPESSNSDIMPDSCFDVEAATGIDGNMVQSVLKLNLLRSEGSNCNGLWLLPSFINHSCMPNASIMQLGAALFVRAAKDIKKGEKLTISYVDPLQPCSQRRRALSERWGFVCKCERCLFEESVSSISQLEERAASIDIMKRPFFNCYDLMKSSESTKFSVMSANEYGNVCAELEDIFKQLLDKNAATQQQVNGLRVSFGYFYVFSYFFLPFICSTYTCKLPSADLFFNAFVQTAGTSETVLCALERLCLSAKTMTGNFPKSLSKCRIQMEITMYGAQSPEHLRTILSCRDIMSGL